MQAEFSILFQENTGNKYSSQSGGLNNLIWRSVCLLLSILRILFQNCEIIIIIIIVIGSHLINIHFLNGFVKSKDYAAKWN